MTKRNHWFKRTAPFAAGVLIGLSVISPVFAATLDGDRVQPWVLVGSLIVLVVGLTLKAMATKKSPTRASDRDTSLAAANDLRWTPSGSAVDVALPNVGMR
jgi:hypothetical protein